MQSILSIFTGVEHRRTLIKRLTIKINLKQIKLKCN